MMSQTQNVCKQISDSRWVEGVSRSKGSCAKEFLFLYFCINS